MSAINLLAQLRKSGISVHLWEGNIKLTGTENKLTPELIAELKKHKEEIILLLARQHKFAALETTEKKEYYPLSSTQKRIYAAQQMETGNTNYNMPLVFHLQGNVDREKLANVFHSLIRRHESLRTSFILAAGFPQQKIQEQVDWACEYNRLPVGENPATALQDFIKPFTLARAPLIRVRLLEIAVEEYLLMVDMHHIISDGISHRVLTQDFIHYYSGNEQPPLTIQYKDYAAWLNTDEQQAEIKKNGEYWLKELGAEIPVLNLKADYPRPVQLDFAGETSVFVLTEQETAALKHTAAHEGSTLFITLLAIFNILLAKLSRQEDIIVGVPAAGRRHADLEKIVGMFINTLALRNYPHTEKTFNEFLQEVRQRSLAAFENQDYPFEDIVEQVSTFRDAGRNPIFDVMFNLLNQSVSMSLKAELPGLTLRPFPVENKTVKFDLSLDGMEIGKQISFTLSYRTQLFKKNTIEKYIAYFKNIIAAAAAGPGQRLGDIELLTEGEKQEILTRLNDTAVGYDLDIMIKQIIEEQAGRTPGEPAAIFSIRGQAKFTTPGDFRGQAPDSPDSPDSQGSQDYTDHPDHPDHLDYRELNTRANGLAQQLTAKGIGPGAYVPVAIDHSLELLISFLAILKTGAAFVPVDVRWPGERIKVVLNDLDQGLVLVSKDNAEAGNEWDRETFVVDLPNIPAEENNPVVRINKDAPIYVMYTSGSTGNPKGVIVPHRGVTNRLFWMNSYFGASSARAVLQTTRYIYDSVVWQFFWPLMNGGKTIILPPDFIMRADHLTELIEKHSITMVDFVPSVFSTIVDNMVAQPQWHEKLISLNDIIMGGEEIIPSAVYKFMNVFPRIRITNLYGPTETTIGCIYHQVTGNEGAKIPIGRPIANVQVYVMNRAERANRGQNLLPKNLPGEIYIAGAGVGLGYLNNIEKTQAVFNKNPFAPGRMMYRTGDLGQWSDPGQIDFFGRIDFQIKIKGVRIEPAEIESKLLKHNQVKEAVVEVKGQGEKDKFLCAYIVTGKSAGEDDFSMATLREFLTGELPAALIPAYFIQLNEIPLTPGGKIDRKALPVPVQGSELASQDQAPYLPPGSTVEKLLVETWEKVLGRERIGVNTNFFQAGGDSIKAIQVISRLNNDGYTLLMKDLFRYPVLSDLAGQVKKQAHIPDQGPITGVIPLTPIQRKFFHERPVDAHHYNQAVLFHSREGFTKETLEYVFSRLQEHHDALRMTYKVDENGNVKQTGHGSDYPLALEVYDLKNRANQTTELQEKINHIQAGIDLEKGPLMKLGLFHLDDGDRLLIVIHHLVIDGVSWRILFEDLEKLSAGYQRGEKVRLPLKSDSFAAWSRKLEEYANSKKFLKEKSYWARLEESIIPPLTGAACPEANEVTAARNITFSLGEEETHSLLGRVNEAFNTESNDILLTALGLGIKKTFGREHILIALEGHGREQVLENINTGRTVGWFTCVYPVVLNVTAANDDIGRQVKEIKETLRKIPAKGIGYGILKYLTAAEHKPEITFKLKPQISFNYLGQFDADIKQLSFADIARDGSGHSQSLRNRREYELDVTVLVARNRLSMSFSYHEKHFPAGTMAALAEHCQSELRRLIAYCCAVGKSEPTPADFTYKDLTIETIDRLKSEYPGLEDLYTLTPMQEGMLFHALHDNSSYAYFEQTSYRLAGNLNQSFVEKSLNELFRRHDILRTAFVYQDVERPLQLVLTDRVCDFYYEDIRDSGSRADKENYIRVFKARDKARTFALSKNALMRVMILQVEDAEYEFTWSFHHIVMDGWCVGILNSEFFEIYNSYEAGRPYRLPAVKPYRTYIQWLEDQDKEISASYWREYLDSFTQPTGIPKKTLAKARGHGGDYRQEQVRLVLSKEKTARLQRLAARRRVTLNSLVQSIWGILLASYNGQEDAVFGTVVSGRPFELPGVESMVGLFINTIPVRIQFAGAMKFHILLEKVQEEAVAAEPYHYHPLAEIQAGHPLKQHLIDHIFVFENYPVAERIADYSQERQQKLTITNVEVFEQTNYDFEIILAGSEHLMIFFQYDGEIYARALIEQVSGHMDRILDQVSENDETVIKQLCFLSEQEEKQLLYEFNNTAVEYPEDKTIPGIFAEQAARTPDRIAVLSHFSSGRTQTDTDTLSLTYRQLNEQADCLAQTLIEKGILAGDIIGIMMERSAGQIIVILGILKAGGAYLPIDPEYPGERIEYILKDSRTMLLIMGDLLPAERNLFEKSPHGGQGSRHFQKLLVNEKFFRGARGSGEILQKSSLDSSNLAYIIYTSGSTGKPKGVLVEHRSVVNLAFSRIREFGINVRDRVLQTSSISFDASVEQIVIALFSGAVLVMISKETLLDPAKFRDFLIYQWITHLDTVPSFLNNVNREDNLGIKRIVVGGEVCSLSLAKKWGRKFDLYNQYGPTEATVTALAMKWTKQDETYSNVPIGKPVANTVVYLFNQYIKPVPVMVPGELYIGGSGVARGYLNNPELTTERFSRNQKNHSSYGSYRTTIFYKTGDLARRLIDGNIEFLGRIDQQVKIRGFRIELGEIEHRLAGYAGIEEAVAAVKTNDRGESYLCAYFTSQKELPMAGLKKYLAGYLPGYMIPPYFTRLEKLPLTIGGKIDYRALPVPDGIDLIDDTAYTAPGTDIEKKLAAVWEKVLDRVHIGVKDNFFDLGGDSIRAIQVISRLSSAGYKLEMKDLFKYPQIMDLAPHVKKLQRVPDQTPVTGKIPLTPIQVEFFAGKHIEPYHANQSVMFYRREGFVKEVNGGLQKIFSRLQDHHDALRMTYHTENEKIVQISHDIGYPLSLVEYDLRGREDSLAELREKVNNIQASIDLEKGPLMKLGLFHLDDGDRLLIVIHHLVIDGVSWRILFEDLETLFKKGEWAVLPLKTDSFALWSEKLQEYADSKKCRQEKAYWAELAALNVPDLKTDYEASTNYMADTQRETFKLSVEETTLLLTSVNAAFKTEINDILLTALGLSLRKTFGEERFLIALEGHGREEVIKDIDISRTVGWFTAVYPIVLTTSYAGDMGRQVKEIKETLRRVPAKGIGYGILKYLSGTEIAFKINPQISFNYLGQFDADIKRNEFWQIAREYAGDELSPRNKRSFELDISGMIVENRLTMNISYNKTHFKKETMVKLAGNFADELRRVMTFCCAQKYYEPTPADFTYKSLSIETLDWLMKEYPGLEDLYTLTPMQEGMLYHALANVANETPGSAETGETEETGQANFYLEQMSYRLRGELDTALVEKSLHGLFQRHDILRTVFVPDILPRPVQVVLKERHCDFYVKDLRDMDRKDEREAFVADYKAKDKEKAFDLSRDVLVRAAVLRIDSEEFEFTWSSHHILMDGWCIGILNNEFLEIYTSLKENRPYRLPTAKPYKTYIEWLEKQDKQGSAQYWQEYLDSFEEQTGVPRISATDKYDFQKFSFILGFDVVSKLNQTAAGNQVTLNSMMQALWAILLGKYNNKEDVVFGAVVSGRPAHLPGIENMIGLFINTVPVRVQFDQHMKFSQVVQNIQANTTAGEPYHYHPLVEIQSASPLKHSLIDHIMVFENYPATRLIEGYGSKLSSLNLSHVEVFGQTNYDFNIVITAAEQLEITFKYNGNAHDRYVVKNMAGHFSQLINQVIQDDALPVGTLTILSQEEKKQLLYDFNATEQHYPQDKTIAQLFAGQAAQTPENVALVGADPRVCPIQPGRTVSLTYRELNNQADTFAGSLIEKGLQSEEIVGLKIEPSMEMPIAILGILKAGGAYLPIDPEYPEHRIEYMLQDSGLRLLAVTNDQEGKTVRRWQGELLAIANNANGLESEKLRRWEGERRGLHHSNLIYAIYTSGTTGKPKGVLIENKNLVNYVYWFKKAAGLTLQDRTVLTSSFCFDHSYTHIYPTILSGCQLHLIPKEILISPEDLLIYIARHSMTFLKMTPSLFSTITASDDFGKEKNSQLRLLLLGGEQIKTHDVAKAHEIWPHTKIMNHYGPTETTIGSIAQIIDFGEFKVYKKRPTIGYPIANTRIAILDKTSAPVPVGIPGELCISGDGVGRGYLNRPELTNAKFITRGTFEKTPLDPPKRLFNHHSPIYKTGDLARWTLQRTVELLGRIDCQVKIRGYRVETREIENYLLTYPGIKETAVIPRQFPAGDNYLCAYIVWQEDPTNSNKNSLPALKEFLADKLPGYMVPSRFVTLTQIPLTPHGKLNRNLLPEPGTNQNENQVTQALEDPVEKKLLAIWSELLAQDLPGVDTNFFEIGGHSLKAALLTTRIYKEFAVKLPVAEVFKNPTIRALAKNIKKLSPGKYLSIEPVEKQEFYETSSGQKRLWILSQSRESSLAFVITGLYYFPEPLNVEVLAKTFDCLIERHESLRTVFLFKDDDVKQKILSHSEIKFRLAFQDLRQSSEKEKIVQELMARAENETFFDLQNGPLFKAQVLQIGTDRYYLLFSMHHIISDYVSMEVLKKDFLQIYRVLARGESTALKPLKIQYKDFTYWQKQQLTGQSLERLSKYWRSQFNDHIPVLELPYDKERPGVQSLQGERVIFTLPAVDTDKLRAIATESGATLFMVLFASLNAFLFYYSGQGDIITGIPAAGREHADLEEQIGFFINTLPLRIKFTGNDTFLELLARVKKEILAAYEHQMYPLEQLLDELKIKKDPARNPLFDVMAGMNNLDASDEPDKSDLSNLSAQSEPKPLEFYKTRLQYDFAATFFEQTKTIEVVFIYQTDLFERKTIIRMVKRYRKIIAGITGCPGMTMANLLKADEMIIPGFSPLAGRQARTKQSNGGN